MGQAFAQKMAGEESPTPEDALNAWACFAETDLALACFRSEEECKEAKERWGVP